MEIFLRVIHISLPNYILADNNGKCLEKKQNRSNRRIDWRILFEMKNEQVIMSKNIFFEASAHYPVLSELYEINIKQGENNGTKDVERFMNKLIKILKIKNKLIVL